MKDKSILISGAGRGLGMCMAKRLLSLGNEVHVIVRKHTDAIDELCGKYRSYHVHIGDVSRDEKVAEALREVSEQTKRLDYVFNVAGIYWPKDRKGLSDLDIDEMAEMMHVNAFGPLRVLKGLDGRIDAETKIVNISSESGSIGNCEDKGMYSYDMSKAALNMATKIYSNEKGGKRRIITVCPGWMRTDMGGTGADLEPDFCAEKIINLAENMDSLPEEELFFKYDGRVLPW